MKGTATAAGWEFDAEQLPEFIPHAFDGLIIGFLPDLLQAGSDSQEMLLSDDLQVDEDIMVGASLGIAQLGPVGLVVLHRRFTTLMSSRVAWAVGTRLRRRKLMAGESPRIVMAGSLPSADMVPDGVTFTCHPVRVRDGGVISPMAVWEVHFPPLVTGAGDICTHL